MKSIPDAYGVGCDGGHCRSLSTVDLAFDGDCMEYADQSYIPHDIGDNTPAVHSSPLRDAERPVPAIPKKPEVPPPLPPELVDLQEPRKESSIDEILELTPPNNPDANGNELMKKIGSSLTKMKDQTASTFNRLLRRTSNTNADLLGMSEMEATAPPTAFTANMDFVHVDASAPASNDDVADLFGLVSLDSTECKEEESDEEAMLPSERKNPFKEEADHLKVQLTMLTLSKQITKEELHFVQQRAAINKKAVERVLQCYLDSCISLAGVIV